MHRKIYSIKAIHRKIDLIVIDDEYNKHYRDVLYKEQKTEDIEDLVKVFIQCKERLDEKLKTMKML